MAADFAREIESHRGYLLRIAQLQLRDRDQAEDVVQDTLVAALSGPGFAGSGSRLPVPSSHASEHRHPQRDLLLDDG